MAQSSSAPQRQQHLQQHWQQYWQQYGQQWQQQWQQQQRHQWRQQQPSGEQMQGGTMMGLSLPQQQQVCLALS